MHGRAEGVAAAKRRRSTGSKGETRAPALIFGSSPIRRSFVPKSAKAKAGDPEPLKSVGMGPTNLRQVPRIINDLRKRIYIILTITVRWQQDLIAKATLADTVGGVKCPDVESGGMAWKKADLPEAKRKRANSKEPGAQSRGPAAQRAAQRVARKNSFCQFHLADFSGENRAGHGARQIHIRQAEYGTKG